MFVCMTNKDSLKMDVAVVKGNHALPPVVPLIWRFCKLISNAITSSTSVFWSQVSIYGFTILALCCGVNGDAESMILQPV